MQFAFANTALASKEIVKKKPATKPETKRKICMTCGLCKDDNTKYCLNCGIIV